MNLDCLRCSHLSDNYLCWDCTKELRGLLLEIAGLAEELETTVTRQSVMGKSAGGKAAEVALMFEERASDVARVVRDTLGPYVTDVSSDELSGSSVYEQINWMARRLADSAIHLARQETAAGIFDEFLHAKRLILRAIDIPPSLVPLGECECGRPILAHPNRRYAKCACGLLYDVDDNREQFKDLARKELVTAKQAESLGEIYGKRITRYAIRHWVSRKKLQPADTSGPEHLYEFGHLLDLAQEAASVGETSASAS